MNEQDLRVVITEIPFWPDEPNTAGFDGIKNEQDIISQQSNGYNPNLW